MIFFTTTFIKSNDKVPCPRVIIFNSYSLFKLPTFLFLTLCQFSDLFILLVAKALKSQLRVLLLGFPKIQTSLSSLRWARGPRMSGLNQKRTWIFRDFSTFLKLIRKWSLFILACTGHIDNRLQTNLKLVVLRD